MRTTSFPCVLNDHPESIDISTDADAEAVTLDLPDGSVMVLTAGVLESLLSMLRLDDGPTCPCGEALLEWEPGEYVCPACDRFGLADPFADVLEG
jgi:hypothetical protein